MNEISPRLFALLPEKSDQALIIVRKRSKLTAIFSWNTQTDEIYPSQWLKGRIYEYFSDLSADGKHLIYSANKKGFGYTVISRAPWLKALSLWRNVGGYGGGVFYGEKLYALYDGFDSYCQYKDGGFQSTDNEELWRLGGVYPKRLLRSGWCIKTKNETETVFTQSLSNDVSIEKIWQKRVGKTIGRGAVCEYHRLIHASGVIVLPTWEWCEVVGRRLVWAERGCVLASPLHKLTIENPQLIGDFNTIQFEALVAPY